MQQLKPFLNDFIKYYYQELGESAGGSLHICLDDGNLSYNDILFCIGEAKKRNDTFGHFIAKLLLLFTTDELEQLYEQDWWGMNK